ncbi:MAG: hypothetical protein ACJ75Q_09635 [Gaiellaceae bacterium]
MDAAGQRLRRVGAPLDREAVLAPRLVLGLQLGALSRVGSKAQAAGPAEAARKRS